MNTPDEFTSRRLYTRGEVWATLAIPETWPKEWATARSAPHRRSSNVRGVWFTYDDVVVIGRLPPRS